MKSTVALKLVLLFHRISFKISFFKKNFVIVIVTVYELFTDLSRKAVSCKKERKSNVSLGKFELYTIQENPR